MAVNFGHMLQGTMTLLGRISLCAIFLSSAIGFNLPNFEDAISAMAHEGVPMPRVALVLAIGSLLAGSLMVIIGWKSKVGAGLLLLFLLVETYYFHDFWTMQESISNKLEMVQFIKNLSLMGAMLFIIANGAGPYSLDARAKGGFSASNN